MQVEEALKLVEHVLSNVTGTRKDHEVIAEALRVIKDAVKKE